MHLVSTVLLDAPGLLHRLPRRHRNAAALRPDGFAAWFAVFLCGQWHNFDANTLTSFKVWTAEVSGG